MLTRAWHMLTRAWHMLSTSSIAVLVCGFDFVSCIYRVFNLFAFCAWHMLSTCLAHAWHLFSCVSVFHKRHRMSSTYLLLVIEGVNYISNH